jgi:hypothetical protein
MGAGHSAITGEKLTMARDFAKPFYNSAAWRKCRAAFIKERVRIDGGVCQRCGQELGYIVHHKIWLTPENINDPEITLNQSNLEYVGLVCHNKIEEGEEAPRYRFTPDGQVEAYSPP